MIIFLETGEEKRERRRVYGRPLDEGIFEGFVGLIERTLWIHNSDACVYVYFETNPFFEYFIISVGYKTGYMFGSNDAKKKGEKLKAFSLSQSFARTWFNLNETDIKPILLYKVYISICSFQLIGAEFIRYIFCAICSMRRNYRQANR